VAAQTVTLDRQILRRLDRALGTAAMVLEVEPNGPAAHAGVVKGDIILGFAGHSVGGVDDLHRLLSADRANTDTVVDILRAGRGLARTVRAESDG
jgi:S1-C subfamily serine protease